VNLTKKPESLPAPKNPTATWFSTAMALDTRITEMSTRIAQIEEFVANVIGRDVIDVKMKLTSESKVVAAVADILGRDVIAAKMREIETAKLDGEGIRRLTALDSALAAGALAAKETATAPDDHVVLEFTRADGIQCHPAKTFYALQEIKEDIRALISGKPVDTVFESPDNPGVATRLVACYGVVETKDPTPSA
jgi:hypothetical protein